MHIHQYSCRVMCYVFGHWQWYSPDSLVPVASDFWKQVSHWLTHIAPVLHSTVRVTAANQLLDVCLTHWDCPTGDSWTDTARGATLLATLALDESFCSCYSTGNSLCVKSSLFDSHEHVSRINARWSMYTVNMLNDTRQSQLFFLVLLYAIIMLLIYFACNLQQLWTSEPVGTVIQVQLQ